MVCGSHPEAAVRSPSVAPSGRATASSRTPSLPPGRCDPSGCVWFSGRRGHQDIPRRFRRLDPDRSKTGWRDDQSIAGPLRPLRLLGNEAAGDQRPERAVERRALQPDRVGRRQDTEVPARSSGGKQDGLGIGELGHDLGPLSEAARNARPCTDRRPATKGSGGPAGAESASPARDSDALRRSEVQVYRRDARFTEALSQAPQSLAEWQGPKNRSISCSSRCVFLPSQPSA